MYHGKVLGVATAVGTTATVAALPNTGSDTAVQIALAAAAGLVVWAGIYVVQSMFGKH
jgi:LPXTG-motif cell wall-anchored protein